MHHDRHFYFGVLCVLVSAIGFSGKAVIVKLAYPYGVDAITLLALRMLFSLPLFVLMAWYANRGTAAIAHRDRLSVLALGALGYYLSSYLDFLGLQYISAGLERLILFLNPTVVVALSALLFKQAITRRHVAALLLCYAGIALVVHQHLALGESARRVFGGGGLVFAAAITYAFYLVAGGRLIARLGAMRFAAHASIAACLFVLAQFLLTRDPRALIVPGHVYWLAVMLAVLSTALPVWLMSEGIHRIGASHAAMLSSVGPVATILLGYVFLSEPITAIQLAGAGLVLLGVAIISRKPKTPLVEPE
ncbi:MAG TPA: DMT family transporter [Burkholderiales bacterium]|nr:DMT family transporter [Burkholderiales bacterium]